MRHRQSERGWGARRARHRTSDRRMRRAFAARRAHQASRATGL
ncbi:hypothetical protein BURMUCGD2M_0604 [Burkholderia multivorans CGD2M]|uniref:Uncharacterized protein n=1 Tax=Burkholderia multivorans CGD2 TaxID=513052 RepID=B9BVT6_9BURK|nr:hypothetical protein BURMUCGD2_0515 [Burkholderia multivorans CGD2]EEE12507.1 hypothetical protein BURMUCGD2M_0604 [Burkholderia multivorans CGD2M]